jgi:hypothetical protein
MAKPTSSSNRSKRKTTKPVTTDKGRNNRAKVSTAKPTSDDTRVKGSGARVTNASQRVSSGSAKVSGTSKPALPARSSASDLQRLQTASRTKPTRPAPRTAPKPQAKPALPPGQKGGAVVSTGTRRTRAEAKTANAAQGSTGPNRIGRSDARPALPQGRSGGALAHTSGNGALARTASSATSGGGRLLGGAGRLLGPAGIAAAMASEVKAMSDRNKTFSWNRDKVKPDANGRGSRGVNTSNGRSVPTGSQQYNDYRNQQIAAERQRLKGVGNPPAAKPKPPAPTQSGGGSTPSRGGGGTSQASQGRSSTTQRSQTASAAPQSGPKRVSAATANRESGNYGTSRTNNPLIDADMKARMRQREDREGVGPVKDGARYSADVKNNTKGVGPVKNADTYSSALKQKSGSEKLKDAISKQRDEQQRRKRNAG